MSKKLHVIAPAAADQHDAFGTGRVMGRKIMDMIDPRPFDSVYQMQPLLAGAISSMFSEYHDFCFDSLTKLANDTSEDAPGDLRQQFLASTFDQLQELCRMLQEEAFALAVECGATTDTIPQVELYENAYNRSVLFRMGGEYSKEAAAEHDLACAPCSTSRPQ